MIFQKDIVLPPVARGFHLITRLILDEVGPLPESGIMHVFIAHTSAGLTLNENADPTVMADFESFFDRLVPDSRTAYNHNQEGPDDMPAHIKASLTASSVSVPIAGNRLLLGTWQGIYLCEFRNHAPCRRLFVTIIS